MFLQLTIEYFLLGLALAMDCFSVSITCGIIQRRMGAQVWGMALLFGFFQALMPLIGWIFGDLLSRVAATNAWISCVLLCFLGLKMIRDGYRKQHDDTIPSIDPSRLKIILMLSIATSIDALSVGFSFTGMGLLTLQQVYYPLAWIGLMSFLMSLFGKYIGVKVGRHIHFPAEWLAGVILILIGLKTVIF